MVRIPADPKQLLKLSLLAFAAWSVPLLVFVLLQSLHLGAALFGSGVATYSYLILHGLLTVLALVLGVLTLLGGPAKSRLIMIVPVFTLLLYAGMLIDGPNCRSRCAVTGTVTFAFRQSLA